ncbi:MAG TPA: DUF3857 domain-containing transglutaminase family protein [Thermoanaerobaculia bacterium]|nr:DUF3857 domain-containing transglutaminase family protein [Thermoanaerobaculia bacterium]
MPFSQCKRLFVFLFTAFLSVPPVLADAPWDEPFDPDAVAIAAAAAAYEPAAEGARVLLEEIVVRYAEDGSEELRYREVVRIESPAAVEGWGELMAVWQPWHQERPEMRARVIAADGTVRELDPATVADVSVQEFDPQVISDARRLRAPMPGLVPGTVVERERTMRDTSPVFPVGADGRMVIGFVVPTEATRLVLDAPASLPLTWRSWLLGELEPHREEVDGRVRWTFEIGPVEPQSEAEPWAPGDVRQQPTIAWTTGLSWEQLSASYAEIVEQQLAGADVAEVAAQATHGAEGRDAKVAALLAEVQRQVRYTGLQFGAAAVVPQPPAETLRRGYGDCKDKSALLVALLREVGIEAHLALVKSGPGEDVYGELPGFGGFDHVVVHLPAVGGEPELWIDATAEWYPAGVLPSTVQGRRALPALREGGGLLTIPRRSSADNARWLERELRLTDFGKGETHEVFSYSGTAAGNLRGWYQLMSAEERAEFAEDYAEVHLFADRLVAQTAEGVDDAGARFALETVAEEVEMSLTDHVWAVVFFEPGVVFEALPQSLWIDPADLDQERRHDFVFNEAYRIEARFRVVPPAGFEVVQLPDDEEWSVGPGLFARRFERGDDGVVEVAATFDSGPAVYTPGDVAAARLALTDHETLVTLHFEHVGWNLMEEGRAVESLAEHRRQVAASDHPVHRVRLVDALLSAGVQEAALREAEAAVEAAPESALAWTGLATARACGPLGRRFVAGWDREGTLAALRRARELDPEDADAWEMLALVLSLGDEGERYGPGSDVEQAVVEYAALRESLAEEEFANVDLVALDAAHVEALIELERYPEAAGLVVTLPKDPELATSRFLALALHRGVSAALRDARGLDDEQLRAVLGSAFQELLSRRRYADTAVVLGRLSRGSTNPKASALVEMMKRSSFAEEATIEGDGPVAVVQRFVQALGRADRAELRRHFEWLGAPADAVTDAVLAALGDDRRSIQIGVDQVVTGLHLKAEGGAGQGYRVTSDSAFDSAIEFFLLPSDDGLRVLGHRGALGGVAGLDERFGVAALDRLRAGDPAGARRWLDWARETISLPDSEDPLAGDPFARLWPLGHQGGEAEIRRAAAALMNDELWDEEALPLLERAREAAEGAAAAYLDLALAGPYWRGERFADHQTAAERLVAHFPESPRAHRVRVSSLLQLDRVDEARALAAARLEADPDDEIGIETMISVVTWEGRMDQRLHWLRREAAARPDRARHNAIAWTSLFVEAPDEETLRLAFEAVEERGTYAVRHTLATVFAELDRPAEALDVLLQLRGDGFAGPQSVEWYVIGRMAETYGETEVARHAYERVEEPETEHRSQTTWTLAQRRLAALARPEVEGGT